MRRTCTSFALLTMLGATPAVAAEPDEPPPTFAYTTPAETKPLRAVAEVAAVYTVGFTWYATTAPTVHSWDVGYRWTIFRQKLTLENFGPDANSFGTNFVGHSLGGTGYYLAARSNRLSILASFGLAVAGSLLWEMFGEVSDIVSMNDMIWTPLAGISIGESTTQLGAYFDRTQGTGGQRVLGSTFAPFKSMNDAFDELTPDRSWPTGSEWHRFRLGTALSFARENASGGTSSKWWPEGRIDISSLLIRLPGYESSGRGALWFDDGNASSIDITATAGSTGLSDFAFATTVVIAGGYYRATTLGIDGEHYGGNGLVGMTTGMQYTLHQYRRREHHAMDRIASVQPLGVLFRQRSALGGPVLTAELAVGPDFGGVTPHADAQYDGDVHGLPLVQKARGYYFGVGGHLRASLELESGALLASAGFSEQGFHVLHGPNDPSRAVLTDSLAHYGTSVGIRAGAIVPRVFLDWRLRAGAAGGGRDESREVSMGLAVGATL